MTIKEIEEQLQVTRANVRFYEKEGLLFPRRNPLNGYREYSDEDVEILRKIIFFRSLDVPVGKIRLYMEGKLELHGILKEQMQRMQEKQEEALQARSLCERLLEQEEQRLKKHDGRWMAIQQSLLVRQPFFRKASNLWKTAYSPSAIISNNLQPIC